mmetsp:Transcript_3227/g.6777  ORF Transcript_3227/g.6777 Transcript_3227/m.6777 type:complete len:344 (-) Transcript_3227:53-1084(-)
MFSPLILLLLALLLPFPSSSTLLLPANPWRDPSSPEGKNRTYASLPASFGKYYLQTETYTRVLTFFHSNMYLCNATYRYPYPLDPNQQYALLVSRGECSFSQKQASALIYSSLCNNCIDTVFVFDNQKSQPLVQMAGEGTDRIGMIGVTMQTGLDLVDSMNLTLDDRVLRKVVQFDGVPYDPYSEIGDWMLVVASIAVMFVGTVACLYLCIQGGIEDWRADREQERKRVQSLLSEDEVASLQDVEVGESEGRKSYFENDSCPVCLDEYCPHDKLKLLPCKHAFHHACIAPWLMEQSNSCPLCKEAVRKTKLPPRVAPPLIAREANPDMTTPLLDLRPPEDDDV